MQTKTTGFVLVTPQGAILAETFRTTRDAAKGWMAMLKMSDGRYHDWKHYYGKGWRCKPAMIQLIEPSNVELTGVGGFIACVRVERRVRCRTASTDF